jgi:hypothetical protein
MPLHRLRVLTLTATLLSVSAAFAEDAENPGFFVHGYATLNYHNFDWQTDPNRRDVVDLERLAVEPLYQVNDWLRFKGEIEFEHGGTGSSMEFDKFEEFGEFESEVEKGGEVQIEELAIEAALFRGINLRLGHIFVPLGFAYLLDEPTDYFTVTRSETEAGLLPMLWHETGAALFGEIGPVAYEAQVVNGLDASGFSSSTWVARGHQGRFETVNAENLAVAGRLDWNAPFGLTVGTAGYFGNSADNRPKPDLHVPAYVGIAQAHAQFVRGPVKARGLFLYGHLDHSGDVSQANRGLSNNLNVKRTPVGASVYGAFLEGGVNVLSFLPLPESARKQALDLFARIDAYDSQWKMTAGYYNNPRWERRTWTAGMAWTLHPRWVLKGQYAYRTLGIPTANEEITYSLGTGLVF